MTDSDVPEWVRRGWWVAADDQGFHIVFSDGRTVRDWNSVRQFIINNISTIWRKKSIMEDVNSIEELAEASIEDRFVDEAAGEMEGIVAKYTNPPTSSRAMTGDVKAKPAPAAAARWC